MSDMIKATITRSKADESITSFQMTGHAEFAKKVRISFVQEYLLLFSAQSIQLLH
ncbi:hypothetical protein ACEQPO_20615 [Bacillus sp. SL00103]